MPKVFVNGAEVEVPAGTSALDAVFHAGFDVPYFCSQEYLSPVGACRMCLVEAGTPRKNPDGSTILGEDGEPKIFYFPKPMASCTLAISDGMVVKTTSDVVTKAQAGMMEFTLLNHPLDCPTCDKGGACELQDRAYEYGYGEARFEFTRRHTDKHHQLSDFIVLDRERCIHCKRCIRYFEEIPGDEVLDFIERGAHTFIGTAEATGRLPSGFSGNITDICPVGALLDEVARFRGRNWEYDRTETTCTACPVGCRIWVDARTGRVERIRGASNPHVNEIWLCDAGRFGHEWVDADDRVRTPLVRRAGQLLPATMEAAVEAIRAGLSGVQRDRIGLYAAADATLEEGMALERFASAVGTTSVDHFPRWDAPMMGADRPTLGEIARSDAIIIVGADVSEEAPVVELRIQEALKGVVSDLRYNHGQALADLRLLERMTRHRSRLAVFAPMRVRLHDHAGIGDVYPPGSEAELLGSLFRARTDPTLDLPAPVKAAGALLAGAQRPVVIVGSFALAHDAAAVLAAAARLGAKVLPIPAAANGAGLELLGLTPGANGRAFGSWEGIEAALVSGSVPDRRRAPGLKLLVAHTSRLTPEAALADVVLPAQTNYEKRGTTVNVEGRVLPLATAAVDGGESLDLIGALGAFAEALGVRSEVRGVRSAQRLLADRLGLDLGKLAPEGAFPSPRPPGRPASRAASAGPSGGDSVLLAPRMWQERMLAGSRRVRDAVGHDELRVSTGDATRLGVREGDLVDLEANGRDRRAVVRVVANQPGPTLPALDGERRGSRAPLRLAVPAGGDD